MNKNKRWEEVFSRRHFLSVSALSGVSIFLGSCASSLKYPQDTLLSNDFIRRFGPIDRELKIGKQKYFSGDDNRRPHKILWDVEGYLATKKISQVEETDLVIVGGGASGLFSAYEFKHLKPIVLEQATRFGGNAKGESWKGLDYSIGSAYIDTPRPGSPMDDYYKQLGLSNVLKKRIELDPVELNRKIFQNFWSGEAEPTFKEIYTKLDQFFHDLLNEKERAFPFIPALNEKHLASVKYYDQFSIHELLSQVAGGKLPPLAELALEKYCWSTYAGSSKELSAAAVLNFLAQEIEPIQVAAGGNSKILEVLLNKISREIPLNHLRTSAVVLKVKVVGKQVEVYYENELGQLCLVKSKAAIMACPKFVVSKILPEIEPARAENIGQVRYRSYMVGNLYLKNKPSQKFYDLFMLGDGKIDFNQIAEEQEKSNASDFVLANFAQESNVGVLTLYRSFAYDGARADLHREGAYEHYRQNFERQIKGQILPALNLQQNDRDELRLTLWGHALPLAAKGLYSGDFVEQLKRPHKERVFFIEQDNWCYPSFQTGLTDLSLMKENIYALFQKS